MIRCVMWLVLILTVTSCVEKQTTRLRGFTDSVSTAQALSGALTTRRRAVVIGVDQYIDPVFAPLKFAGVDAQSMADLLLGTPGRGFDDVSVLTGPTKTTRAEVLREMRRLQHDFRREDVLVVYFSGHGTRVRDGDRWRRFLLTGDSRASDLEGTAIDLEALQMFFSSLPPARKALVIDACFSGDGKSVVRPESGAEDEAVQGVGSSIPRATTMGPGEAHLYATSPGRPAREDDELGHGVYTWYLMEAMSWGFADADLDGDQVVTAYEAHDYARVKAIHRTDGVQVPEAAFRVVGEADIVLAGSPDEQVRRDRSLVYLYPTADEPLSGASLFVDGRYRGTLPGTVPIDGGRHHVRVNTESGDVASEGYVILSGGNSYSVQELQRLVAGPKVGFGVRTSVVMSAPMAFAMGDAAPGIVMWGFRRANRGAARGLMGELEASLSIAPRVLPGVPTDDEGTSELALRALFTAGLGIAYQEDYQRLRYRVGWGAQVMVLPPSMIRDYGGRELDEIPEQTGWLVAVTGPSANLGYVVDSTWSVMAGARVHGTLLNFGADTRFVPWTTLSFGVEASL